MARTEILRLEGVRKHFPVTKGLMLAREIGKVHAVDGIDLAISESQTLALVGESGCGKTTTARLVLRLETPTEGRVLLEGEDIHRLQGPALKRYRTRVQAVFQDPWRLSQPAHAGAGHRGGNAAGQPRPVAERDGAKGREGAARRGASARTGPELSARVQRWPAPAHRDRERAHLRAEAADPGRARLGPRRLHPLADHEPAAGPPAAVRHDLPAGGARPRHHPVHGGLAGGDVPRADLRVRGGGVAVRGAPESLHQGAFLGRAARPPGRASRGDHPGRRGALTHRSAFRMLLSPPAVRSRSARCASARRPS